MRAIVRPSAARAESHHRGTPNRSASAVTSPFFFAGEIDPLFADPLIELGRRLDLARPRLGAVLVQAELHRGLIDALPRAPFGSIARQNIAPFAI
jgi:hypothetical protein